MPPAVSILMPTFNRLEFLPPAIEWVFAQSFTDWERIIDDDDSGTGMHTGRPPALRNAVRGWLRT